MARSGIEFERIYIQFHELSEAAKDLLDVLELLKVLTASKFRQRNFDSHNRNPNPAPAMKLLM
jgi:hypothetical protein